MVWNRFSALNNYYGEEIFMSNYIKVSINRMKNDADDLQDYAEKIPKFVNELESAMKSLGECWDGPAWIAFQQQVKSDILNMLDVYEWLSRYLQAMSRAEKTYADSEKRSYDCVNSVRI